MSRLEQRNLVILVAVIVGLLVGVGVLANYSGILQAESKQQEQARVGCTGEGKVCASVDAKACGLSESCCSAKTEGAVGCCSAEKAAGCCLECGDGCEDKAAVCCKECGAGCEDKPAGCCREKSTGCCGEPKAGGCCAAEADGTI